MLERATPLCVGHFTVPILIHRLGYPHYLHIIAGRIGHGPLAFNLAVNLGYMGLWVNMRTRVGFVKIKGFV